MPSRKCTGDRWKNCKVIFVVSRIPKMTSNSLLRQFSCVLQFVVFENTLINIATQLLRESLVLKIGAKNQFAGSVGYTVATRRGDTQLHLGLNQNCGRAIYACVGKLSSREVPHTTTFASLRSMLAISLRDSFSTKPCSFHTVCTTPPHFSPLITFREWLGGHLANYTSTFPLISGLADTHTWLLSLGW